MYSKPRSLHDTSVGDCQIWDEPSSNEEVNKESDTQHRNSVMKLM